MMGFLTKALSFIKTIPPIYGVLLVAFVSIGGYITKLKHDNELLKRDIIMGLYVQDSLEAVGSENQILISNLLDGMYGVIQRAAQTELLADSLDMELQQRPAVRGEVLATVDTVRVDGSADLLALEDSSSFTSHYEEYQEPFSLSIDMLIRPADRKIGLQAMIALDPAPLSFRIGCMPYEDGEINSAQMSVIAPDWLNIQITEVMQAREVCNPAPPRIIKPPFYQRPIFVIPTTAAILLGGLKLLGVL